MSRYKDLMETAKAATQALADRFDLEEEKLLASIEKLEDENQILHDKLEVATTSKPAWGNCRMGCPESYLDPDGFCSPSCSMGGLRGRYYAA